MSKKLEDIFQLISLEVGHRATANSAEKYCKAFYKIFLKQLKLNGKLYIPKFGTFYLQQKEEKIIKVGDPHKGGTKFVHVKPTYYIEFIPSSFLDRTINETNFRPSIKKPKDIKKQTENRERANPSMCSTITQMLNKAQENANK